MAKATSLLATFLVLVISLIAQPSFAANVFEQKQNETPKWSRFYAKLGRATGEYGNASKSFNVNYFGYKQMRGMFSYGAQAGFLYNNGDKVQSIEATMSFRPDWNLEAEPSFDLSYGTADLSGPTDSKNGRGTLSSIGVSLDVIKGKFYSTTLGVSNVFLKADSQDVKSTSFQAVTISLNFDLY